MDISWILVACLGIYILYLDKVWVKRLEKVKPRNPRYDHYLCTIEIASKYFISSSLVIRTNNPYTEKDWDSNRRFKGRVRSDHCLFLLTHDLQTNVWMSTNANLSKDDIDRLARCCVDKL